jgi:hypothetical protein
MTSTLSRFDGRSPAMRRVVWLLSALAVWAWPAGSVGTCAEIALGRGVAEISPLWESATRDLQLARQNTEKAKLAARAERTELESFVAVHFEEHRLQRPDLVGAPQPSSNLPEPKRALDPEWNEINRQLQDLLARRDELLERFTTAHPEVADAEQRIALLSDQLAALGDPGGDAEGLSPGQLAESPPSGGPPSLENPTSRSHSPETDAEQYQRIFERWQTAERNLQLAVAAENDATRRLAAIEPPANAKPQGKSRSTAKPVPAVADGRLPTSQPLALAALLIALAVAALAAVRLARSDSSFSNLDEVAAALALPVICVIPGVKSAGGRRTSAASITRGVVFVAELVVAFFIFVMLAYGVQNAPVLWRLGTHPVETLNRVAELFSN